MQAEGQSTAGSLRAVTSFGGGDAKPNPSHWWLTETLRIGANHLSSRVRSCDYQPVCRQQA